MRLLFDENLSPRLAARLEDLFPGSVSWRRVHLDGVEDASVLAFAEANGFVVVTKDADFVSLTSLGRSRAKVCLLMLGNCTNDDIEQLLRRSLADLHRFVEHPEYRLLRLPLG